MALAASNARLVFNNAKRGRGTGIGFLEANLLGALTQVVSI